MYSTGNYIQYLVITYNGKEYEKNHTYLHTYTYTYTTESFFCPPETNTTLKINSTSIYKRTNKRACDPYSTLLGARGWAWGSAGSDGRQHKVATGVDENASELDVAAQLCERTKSSEFYMVPGWILDM